MPDPTHSPRAILVVDDNADLRHILQEKLTAWGYQVTTAANGHDAAAVVARERFDLVLTDWFMPGKDGLAVLRELYKTHATLPVVVMSGGGPIMSAAQCAGAARLMGAAAVLAKPFSNDELRKAIALALPERPA